MLATGRTPERSRVLLQRGIRDKLGRRLDEERQEGAHVAGPQAEATQCLLHGGLELDKDGFRQRLNVGCFVDHSP